MFTRWFNMQHMASRSACAHAVWQLLASPLCTSQSTKAWNPRLLCWNTKDASVAALANNTLQWSPSRPSKVTKHKTWPEMAFFSQPAIAIVANLRFSSVFQSFLFAKVQIMLEMYSIMLFNALFFHYVSHPRLELRVCWSRGSPEWPTHTQLYAITTCRASRVITDLFHGLASKWFWKVNFLHYTFFLFFLQQCWNDHWNLFLVEQIRASLQSRLPNTILKFHAEGEKDQKEKSVKSSF